MPGPQFRTLASCILGLPSAASATSAPWGAPLSADVDAHLGGAGRLWKASHDL